jgi:hypothetical protein
MWLKQMPAWFPFLGLPALLWKLSMVKVKRSFRGEKETFFLAIFYF